MTVKIFRLCFGKYGVRTVHSAISGIVSVLISAALALPFCGCSVIDSGNASECALIYRADSGDLLYCSECDVHIAPASLTKLLTASVALKYISSEQVFSVGSELDLVHQNSSLCLISRGQRLRLYDLIAGMLMVSGNDAAYTVAVSTAKEVNGNKTMTDVEAAEFFCGLMNDFAESIGMSDSHFTSPDGWDSEEQYTTLQDLLILAKYAWSVPEIREIASTAQKYTVFESGENITWTNSNRLLNPDSEFYCQYAAGLKTGTTTMAGSCLIAVFEKEGREYISIVAGCPNDKSRYELTLKLFRMYAGL